MWHQLPNPVLERAAVYRTGRLVVPALPPWMKITVDCFQAVCFNMGVNLGGCNICMAEHHLYRP